MTAISYQGDLLDKLDKRILLALEDDILSAKGICTEWALPESDASRVRYRIRERLGRGAERLVQTYGADETPGAIHDRKLYSLTNSGEEFVRANRELLTTPESIDELRDDINEVRSDVQQVENMTVNAEDIATSQRERVNDLQRDKHAINDRSKENRKRLQKLEREVLATEWDASLQQLIDEVAEGAKSRYSELEHEIERTETKLRDQFVSYKEYRETQRQAEKAWNWAQSLRDSLRETEEKLKKERARNDELEQRLTAIEQELFEDSSGLKDFFYK